MRFRLGIGSKAKRLFLSSPAREKPVNGENPVGEFEFRSKTAMDPGLVYRGPYFGSKEETFFDSKAWLDSDCEDDYYSVNGDFTPSGGSTPNYQIINPAAPQLNKSLLLDAFPVTISEPSPTDGKKKLLDLLQDTFQGELGGNEQNAGNGKDVANGKPDSYKVITDQPPKSSEGTPYFSGASTDEETPSRPSKNKKERSGKSTQCCFPSLVPNLGFSDRRKQKMSPGR